MRKGCEYQVMTELKKQMIHMNRQKETAVSQITLDDDFIVPDTMDDVAQILMDRGEIQIESARPQGERMLIRGKLLFYLLYRKAEGGLQALGGEIPFDEVVNVPGLADHDPDGLDAGGSEYRNDQFQKAEYQGGGNPNRAGGESL